MNELAFFTFFSKNISFIAKYDKPEGGIDYYIKWESLPYSEATWEDSGLIQRKWPEKIREFNEREESRRTPSKHCKALKIRPKFHEVKSQPSYMTGVDNVSIIFFFFYCW